jgi:hypothetical protein
MVKTFLLVGLTGSGKSTTGNCILNRSGEYAKVNNTPFEASDSASGVTEKFEKAQYAQELIVVDSIGFGDPQFNQSYVFGELKKALADIDNRIDGVLFVMKAGKFRKEMADFFELVQERVFKNKCKNNSHMIITSCRKGWCEKQTDPFFRKALANCNDSFFEFNLKFADEDQNQDESSLKELRQSAIDGLVEFLDSRTSDGHKVDLSYLQTEEFSHEWVNEIVPLLLEIMARFFGDSIGDYLKRNSTTNVIIDFVKNFLNKSLSDNQQCNMM